MAATRARGMKPQLLHGAVWHARLRPQRNGFRYSVFFLRFSVGDLHRLENALFSINRWNLFSFHYRDHGARDGSHPELWIRAVLAREGLTAADGDIWLQTFPRILGYVFNPVSFWLCHDRAGALRVVLCEVNNTFGEHHHYLLAHADRRPILTGDTLTACKMLHVSPFCEVAGQYHFLFKVAQDASRIHIDYEDKAGTLLLTGVAGYAAPYGVMALLRAFVRYPWMTLGIILRIHYQALRLWLKGVRWFAKPLPPSRQVTR